MSETGLNVPPSVARSIELWHDMVWNGDLSELHTIVHPEAVFRSPIANTPYASADAVILALTTAFKVFNSFAYHRHLASADGLSVVLEFSAKVSGKDVRGIDLIRFNQEGAIEEFEVMVRPMSGLQALAEEMGKRLADKLPAYKVKA